MGFDYGFGMANISDCMIEGERIRYGVISMNEVCQAWSEESAAIYPEDTCAVCGDVVDITCDKCICGAPIEENYCIEPLGFAVNDGEYMAESDSYGDIFITKSPYYTTCGYCSLCVPGAGHLMTRSDECKALCFGPDWFEGQCPYPVYRLKDKVRIN